MGLITSDKVAGKAGEVVSWDPPAGEVPHARVVAALADAGLDAKFSREFAPRNAFCRACRRLAQKKIVRVVGETDRHLSFQFTGERLANHVTGDRLEYDFEAILSLDKSSNKVTCTDPGLASLAQAQLDAAMEARTAADVTSIAKRAFAARGDLFPLRKSGGCYFVPESATPVTLSVEKFLGACGGELHRLPIQAGTDYGDKSVREAVRDGLSRVVGEHLERVACFDELTRTHTLERAAEKIRETRFKIEAYADYLADEAGRLREELARADTLLRAKAHELVPVAY